ncbi:MAG: hypothetical protein BWZ07_01434 [Alphaproteobacteria bacterium ADurb.BinA280]|nr:hypothetical protein [Xanthomonadales bacterium]MCC6507193.1 hypothetical protein [Aquimonas sp.]OPZ12273.1 MAG: hypothetical protein BWZ07_01434 [Alphaproteobacteria bacterium ADurb.BinA280]
MKLWSLLCIVGLGLAGPIAAEEAVEKESEQPDKRLIEALESEGLKYEILDTGELSVLIEWTDENRSQIVRLQSKTFRFQQHEYRDIYSLGYEIKEGEQLPIALATRLLTESNTSKLGFWALQEHQVYNIARMASRSTPSQIREAIFYVAQYADDLEKELLGTDDF